MTRVYLAGAMGAGSEPDQIKIDDLHEAVGELSELDAPCENFHDYTAADGFRCCIRCGKRIRS